MRNRFGCYICQSNDIFYTDIFAYGWCQDCYDEEFTKPTTDEGGAA